MAVVSPKRNCWLLDSAADMHVCNQRSLFATYFERCTPMAGALSAGVSPGYGTVRLALRLKNGSSGRSLKLENVYYIPQCPASLVSLSTITKKGDIWWDQKRELLYLGKTRQEIGHVLPWKKSFVLRTQDIPDDDLAVHLTQMVNSDVFQWPKEEFEWVLHTTKKPESLKLWHTRLAHLNFPTLRAYLKSLSINFIDDVNDTYLCDSCALAKATKSYNRHAQTRAVRQWQYTHTDLVGPIVPAAFLGERYFFTFTDDCTRMTETYTGKTKDEWFNHMKAYHNRARTVSGIDRPMDRIRSDFGTELRSDRVDKWFTEMGIVYEPSAPYSQEENGVSERCGRTLLTSARATILGGGLPDDLWAEIILAMTYIKNIRPTNALKGISPYEAAENKTPNLDNLRTLGSTVYVFLHEGQRALESTKFKPRAKKGKLVGYDGSTIYRVYIQDDQAIVRIKDLRIVEDADPKNATAIQTYEGIMVSGKQGRLADQVSLPEPESTHISKAPVSATIPGKPKISSGRTHPDKLPEDVPIKTASGRTSRPPNRLHETQVNENTDRPNQVKRRRGRPRKDESTAPAVLIAQLSELLTIEDWSEGRESANVLYAEDFESTYEVEPNTMEVNDPLVLLSCEIAKLGATSLEDLVTMLNLEKTEPETYKAAIESANAYEWSEGMDDEIKQLDKNNTWDIVPIEEMPEGHRALSGKWVFKIKRGARNEVVRFKARWVVKGFMQQYGVNYDQTFAAVVKPMAFRALFAIAAYYDLDADQLDVKTAFLYGDIDTLIFVKVPDGYDKWSGKRVCRLNKALYGLKQSPRLWYEKLSNFLLSKLGLKKTNADHSIFVTEQGINGPIVSTWVDDINVFGQKGANHVSKVKQELSKAFEMVDMGEVHYYLGLTIERDRAKRTIKITQQAYIEKILAKFGMENASGSPVPMKEEKLLPNSKQATEQDIKTYGAKVGSIMFSMIETRPDIAYATGTVSRYSKNPGTQHKNAVQDIFRYLAKSTTRGITYGGQSELQLTGYSDSDWGGNTDGRKSISGYVFMINGGPVSWQSKRQNTVALSSTESEYVALTSAAKEATWYRLLLTELGILQPEDQHAEIRVSEDNKGAEAVTQDNNNSAIMVYGDNQSAIALANNPVYHARTKHIDIQHHYIRDEVSAGRIQLRYIPSGEMVADGLTKPLPRIKFNRFLRQLNMEN
jgi:hypothetical protein